MTGRRDCLRKIEAAGDRRHANPHHTYSAQPSQNAFESREHLIGKHWLPPLKRAPDTIASPYRISCSSTDTFGGEADRNLRPGSLPSFLYGQAAHISLE